LGAGELEVMLEACLTPRDSFTAADAGLLKCRAQVDLPGSMNPADSNGGVLQP
jgi:hypothetical protein